MGLTIYKLNQTKDYLTTIESIDSIKNALNELKKTSGISIDEYGKTRLYQDHIKFLLHRVKTTNEWASVFKEAIEKDFGLLIEGD